MPFYRFASTDKFINTVVTHPSIEFIIYSGSAYYNQQISLSGNFNANTLVKHIQPGYLSLYEYNIDRPTGAFGSIPAGMPTYTTSDDGGQYVSSSGLIYPWIAKDGTRIAFKTVTNLRYTSELKVGDVLSGSYPMKATISKEFYAASDRRHREAQIEADTTNTDYGDYPNDIRISSSVSHLYALKNVMEGYRYLNPHYSVSSSYHGARQNQGLATWSSGRNLTASTADGYGPGAIDVGLISIPSIFYGSGIKKGSVRLQYYVTGNLIAELRDTYKNGVLVQSLGAAPHAADHDGQIAGVVMYNEGFIVLTGSWTLGAHTEAYTGGSPDNPRWIYFGQSISGSITAHSSSFAMHMSGTNKTQTITLLADAKKSELNHSNNPSYLTYGTLIASASASAAGYKELNIKGIKNIVSSSYNDPTGSFKKTTYISKIGIYDRNKNLIAIAKVATPVKKTEDRDFTFKLKLDI